MSSPIHITNVSFKIKPKNYIRYFKMLMRHAVEFAYKLNESCKNFEGDKYELK